MTTPFERYQTDLKRPDFVADASQEETVRHTQQLYERLLPAIKTSSNEGLAKLRHFFRRSPENFVLGLYVWGGVGRGKTYLIDNFYSCLPFKQKLRLHFHSFMQYVHSELKILIKRQNPLTVVAKHLAKQVRVICLDEFNVSDITDAMLLSGLLKALFDQHVTLVATSNVAPDDLYKNGLQRERFLPAIALIKQHTKVIHINDGVDYRLQMSKKTKIYYYPLNKETDCHLLEHFKQIASDEGMINAVLEINKRRVQTVRFAEKVVWFDFQALCDIPRAVADYIYLARRFNTVLISNICRMEEGDDDRVLRLIDLIDEFYDHNVKLFLSAQVPPEQLYTGKSKAFQFQRTLSRLEEMRSQTYLDRLHLP